MNNIFVTQPEWIADDDRIHRQIVVPSPTKSGPSFSYTINADFMYDRHRIMLPPELIKDKTILDIGSCMGATGAWCLANGAKHYTGIEQLERYVKPSTQLFEKYFQPDQYNIVQQSFADYTTTEKFDIIVASGVLYAVFDPFEFLSKVASLAADVVIVDTVHPFNGYRRLFPDATDEDRRRVSKLVSIIQPSERIRMQNVGTGGSARITASIVSLQALVLLMKKLGFAHNPAIYDIAEKEIPYYYDIAQHNRYMTKFFFSDIDTSDNLEVAVQWTGNLINK